MEKTHHQVHHTELHFLPIHPPEPSTSRRRPSPKPPSFHHQLDLQLSISLNPFKPPKEPPLGRRIEMLRWQASEQRRLASMERAYAERIRELTRREMELAQSELARARVLWDRTKEDVSRVEITCHSCRRKFRPINDVS